MDKGFYEKAVEIWQQMSKSSHIDFPELSQKTWDMNAIFHVGPCYYYYFDLHTAALLYISPEIKEVLGLEQNISVEALFQRIHPQDVKYFIAYEEQVSTFFAALPIHQILNYKVSYDFRIRHAQGHYLRLLQQVICINHTEQGKLLHTLGLHSDISHIKAEGRPMLSFIGLNGAPSFLDCGGFGEAKEIQLLSPYSKRELEVLRLLSQGYLSKEISEKLFISAHTVNQHRKNILKKGSHKSIHFAIYHAVSSGWI